MLTLILKKEHKQIHARLQICAATVCETEVEFAMLQISSSRF